MSNITQYPDNIQSRLNESARFRPYQWFLYIPPRIDDEPGTCPNCGGSGHVYVRWVRGAPMMYPPPYCAKGQSSFFWEEQWYLTELTGYPCPWCNGERAKSETWEDTGLTEEERLYSLEFFQQFRDKRQMYHVLNTLIEQKKPVGWLSLVGGYGVGKSGAMKSIVAFYAAQGLAARYIRAEDILSELRSTFNDNSDVDEHEVKRKFGRYDVLAIDEVDRVSKTDWARATLATVLDERHRTKTQNMTLLATNTRPDDFPADMKYLASRMLGEKCLPIGGQDLRKRND